MSRSHFVITFVTSVALVGYGLAGCAADEDPDSSDNSSSGNTGGSTASNQGGATGGTGAVGGGNVGPCGTDCSAIQTPQCQVAQCNTTTGMCEVVNDEDGVSCDDGVFCTISDSCSGGTCVGGPQNDCGMQPAACNEITCDETSMTCSDAPANDGTPCQDANNLCNKGMACSNGLCLGGMLDDCFFTPTPECHIAECDPLDGVCKPVVGPDDEPCNDPNDLCTVNKTCLTGTCIGGDPKNCSQLTLGCVLGVCDVNNGQCVTQNLMNNDPCDDLDACTSGELCTNGSCTGGAPVTACVNNDGCCPSNCNANNDIDCACGVDKLKLSEMHIGTSDYIAIFNPTTCAIDIDPLEVFFDDSSLTDVTFNVPTYSLPAGGTVYLVEGTPMGPDEISVNTNIPYSSTRGGATLLCNGSCSTPSNVIDVCAFSEGSPHSPLPNGITFVPGGLTGITNESTNSYLRNAYIGQTPSFLASDWIVGAKTN